MKGEIKVEIRISKGSNRTQQLQVQCKIKEQAQVTNARFAAIAEQMQQLIATTTISATARNNPLMPRPLPANLQFHCEELCDVYITNETFQETKLALTYNCMSQTESTLNRHPL
uniref:Uncharacterized protein n=1 Tax=Romanomermis culicivorax TaxID=13658 RepID=A0A915I9I1_ROMCU